jgi:hypothetical protein
MFVVVVCVSTPVVPPPELVHALLGVTSRDAVKVE